MDESELIIGRTYMCSGRECVLLGSNTERSIFDGELLVKPISKYNIMFLDTYREYLQVYASSLSKCPGEVY